MTSDTDDSTNGSAEAAASELLPIDQFAQYMLHSKGEMFTVLQGLAAQVAQITMFFNEGHDMLLTDLVRYGNDGLDFDIGPSPETNRKALAAERLFCVARLDGVKIQFILNGLRQAMVDGQPTFHAALPDGILRLQRRESYRLKLSLVRPVKCKLQVPLANGKLLPLEATIADISCGGVCLVDVPIDCPLAVGQEIPACEIDLPGVGKITAGLNVRNFSETRNGLGVHSWRVGYAFVGLPGPMSNLIQRYIINTERERKAKESGLA